MAQRLIIVEKKKHFQPKATGRPRYEARVETFNPLAPTPTERSEDDVCDDL
jgi:hypothetical protein